MTDEDQRPLFLLSTISYVLESYDPPTHFRSCPRVVEFIQQAEGEICDSGCRLAEGKLRIVSERKYSGVRQFIRQEVLQPEMSIIGSPCFSGVPVESVYRDDTVSDHMSVTIGEGT